MLEYAQPSLLSHLKTRLRKKKTLKNASKLLAQFNAKILHYVNF